MKIALPISLLLACLTLMLWPATLNAQPKKGGTTIGVAGAQNPATYHLTSNYSLSDELIIDGPVIIVADGNFSVGNNEVTITPNGSLELYVAGNVTMSGNGAFNNTNKPATLMIYGTSDSTQSLTLNGNGFLSAVVYAPNAAVTSNGGGNSGALLGAVIANTITFHGSPGPFHFDEALLDLDTGMGGYRYSGYRLISNLGTNLDPYGNQSYRNLLDQYFD
jgi:hypothetical protein